MSRPRDKKKGGLFRHRQHCARRGWRRRQEGGQRTCSGNKQPQITENSKANEEKATGEHPAPRSSSRLPTGLRSGVKNPEAHDREHGIRGPPLPQSAGHLEGAKRAPWQKKRKRGEVSERNGPGNAAPVGPAMPGAHRLAKSAGTRLTGKTGGRRAKSTRKTKGKRHRVRLPRLKLEVRVASYAFLPRQVLRGGGGRRPPGVGYSLSRA